MNTYTENTHQLVKIFYFSDFMKMTSAEFSKVMVNFHAGRYDLIIINEE